MPFYPPGDCDGRPNHYLLEEGTNLWRVHSRHRCPDSFNATLDDRHLGGGRFSGTVECPYPSLYVSLSADTALAERLLRSLPFTGSSTRMIPRAAVAGRRLSTLTVTAPLLLLSLVTTADLASVCQDEWLIHADPREYGLTRRWAHWLHRSNPWAQGLIWSSRRNLGELTAILFGDRCGTPPTTLPSGQHDLDDVPGTLWVNQRLAKFGAAVAHPRTPLPTQ